MNALMSQWWVITIAIFVAMNVVSTAPIYLAMTEGMNNSERPALVRDATAMAAVVSIVICFLGNSLLTLMGVTLEDLRIAGGIVLIGLGFHDLVHSRQERKSRGMGDIGPVPIGVPLMVGPATMTTLMIGAEESGQLLTSLALAPNLILSWVVMRNAHRVVPLVGESGSKALGKVMSLFLVAIGVAMIRGSLQILLR
jgi:multiple antibiotic resistance protein